MFCTNCGAQNPDEARFCSGCGCDLHPAQAAGAQPAKSEAPKSNGQEKKVEIKSPASAKTGMTLGIIAMVLAGVSMPICIFAPSICRISGPLSIILSVLAIVLSTRGLRQVNRNYREIAMQNIIYRDEYNRAKYTSYVGIICGIFAVFFGLIVTYGSRLVLSWWY
ncbi:MAG: zinc ribbon domain-containing protein [Clostridiales bacterium]|nr:zinc ribbon domain-containing protein [Clostridiales bacterium]